MKILSINTSEMGKVAVRLEDGDRRLEIAKEQKFGSQVLLNMIEDILQQAGLEMKDLEEIKVNTGPGSFTGIRVGVSVANALGFGLGIPVNGKKMETEIRYT
jgi:tRNA threonylcarbamoyladenosine biosynthesis protein TsaB